MLTRSSSERTQWCQIYCDAEQRKSANPQSFNQPLVPCTGSVAPCCETLLAFGASQTNNEMILIMERLSVTSWLLQTGHVCSVLRHTVYRSGCASFVDRPGVWPVIPYQRKYGRPYHVWLGCPRWPFYQSHMSWIPDLIASPLPCPLYCFIAILFHTDYPRIQLT